MTALPAVPVPTRPPAEALRRHDLRTPVNHILGYGEMLLEDAEAAGRADRVEGLVRIRETARDMIGLIDAILPTPALLGPALRAPAGRVLEEVDRLRRGPPVGPGDEADLRRMADAVATLLRLAEPRRAGPEVQGSECGEAGDATVAAGSAAGGAAGRVLVVDDDPANRELLGRRAEREGYAVTRAASGTEALGLLERGAFDVVLLDLVMPGMGGDEVLGRMKADPRLADLPVLMISSLDEQDAVVRCIAMGAEDYLPKAGDPVLLRARIGASLRKKRARDTELAYLQQVRTLTAAAAAVQAGGYEEGPLEEVAARDDALGTLARVFRDMAREVRAREARLAAQVAELRIEIDEARKARTVAEIVESDAFQQIRRRAAELRRPHG